MKFSSIFGKEGFGKGSFGGKDSSGQSIKCIGGAHPRALSPRRWGKQKGRLEQSNCIGYSPFSPAAPKCFGRAARRVPSPSGRSMIEMLAVLAIIGVLSITALVGFTYAMNKHRANETIYDVMLRGTNVPMVDENYASKPSGHEFRFPDLPAGTYYPMTTKKDAGRSYYVEATGVTYRVCEMILKMNPTDIDQIVVNNSVYMGDSDICGNTDGLAMKFCFGSDGTICDGTGQGGSGGSSGETSGGSGSGSGTDPVDPCEGIVPVTDCGAADDMLDQNGCLIVQKISCGSGSYCSGQTCEPCPAADTCSGESCCALTGPDDVCGNPTKEIGTISTITHSDLNGNGCCEETTEESCSLNPITPRTCTPTCDGTCQGDGTCRPNCAAGESYNETAGQCCANITEEETDCQKLVPAMPGVCPHFEFISTEGFPCTTTDGLSGTCQSGVCEATSSCTDGTIITGNNGHHYCVSMTSMSWSNADTWCEARGRHLASMDEACPGWDASLEEGACANINNLGGMAWSSTLDKADWARLLVGTEESTIFLSAGVNLSSRAFCY